MRFTPAALAILVASFSASSPVPGADEPISDDKMARIKELGLDKRDAAGPLHRRVVNEPIPEDKLARIKELGLDRRSDEVGVLEVRDKRSNCGDTIEGENAGGNGIWCPLQQYFDRTDEFCGAYAGTDIHKNHETSDTYGIDLTNQGNDKEKGDAVNKEDCIFYMRKQSNVDSLCYGSKHNDTEGGYWSVDKIGLFGSEVWKGAPK
ncbi:MAG: hypothetical protein Q9176_003811 [Flavoplaca citrina]